MLSTRRHSFDFNVKLKNRYRSRGSHNSRGIFPWIRHFRIHGEKMAQPATSCSLVSCVWQQSVLPQNATDRRTCFGYHVTEHLLLRTYANFRLFAFLWKLFSVLKAVFLFNAKQYRTEFDAIFATPQTKKLCFFSQRLVSHYCLLTVKLC